MQTGQTDQCSAEFMQGTWWDSPKTGLTSQGTKTCRNPVCVCVWGVGSRYVREIICPSVKVWIHVRVCQSVCVCMCVRWDTIACSIIPLTYIDHIHIKVSSLNPGPFSRHLVYWYQTVLRDRNAQVKPIVFFPERSFCDPASHTPEWSGEGLHAIDILNRLQSSHNTALRCIVIMYYDAQYNN